MNLQNPTAAPSTASTQTTTAPDSFETAASDKVVLHDDSATRALEELGATAGPTFTARELALAIAAGTKDPDGQATTVEYRDFARWAQAHGDQLTTGAKTVMSEYRSVVRTARAQGETTLSAAKYQSMLDRMNAVGETDAAPAATTGAGSARDFQRAAMSNADDIFKRQSYSPKWNPNGPSKSHNCATTSLAMAVEAFGLEPAGLNAPGHVNDQKSIALTAEAMGKTDDKHPGDFGATSSRKIHNGATELGLEAAYRSSPSVADIDQALAKGHMMVLFGKAGSDYQRAMGHDYGDVHSVLVMGKTDDGRYLVADPLSRKGPVPISAAVLADFETRGQTSNEVWRGA